MAIDLYRVLVELAWSRALQVLISNSVGILYFHPFRDIILLILRWFLNNSTRSFHRILGLYTSRGRRSSNVPFPSVIQNYLRGSLWTGGSLEGASWPNTASREIRKDNSSDSTLFAQTREICVDLITFWMRSRHQISKRAVSNRTWGMTVERSGHPTNGSTGCPTENPETQTHET